MRRILLLKPHEYLLSGYQQQAMGVSSGVLNTILDVPGVRVHDEQVPAPIVAGPQQNLMSLQQLALGGAADPNAHRYVMTAEIPDQAAADQLLQNHPDVVEGVFADPEIAPFPTLCPGAAIGAAADVLLATNMAPVHAAGSQGAGVKILVVDTGIDGTQVNVAGGPTLYPGAAPGTAPPTHGTMVAKDALITAPNALIFDYALLQSKGGRWVGFLSDAIRAYAEILTQLLQSPGRYVVNNSWGMYDRSQDAPKGNPQNYWCNPTHPFNLIVGTVIQAGADVLFAAGNCGQSCADPRCGAGDIGPGSSIHGANSHPDAISVGAITTQMNFLGYSSQGPGSLAADKPDLVAPSHFQHSGIYPADSGTSAACPVLAGVVAALRSNFKGRTVAPARMRDVLRTTANSLGQPRAWNGDTGWGLVDAGAALAALP